MSGTTGSVPSSSTQPQARPGSNWATGSRGTVVTLEAHPSRQEQFTPGFRSIDSLIDKLEAADPAGMQEARQWAADALYPDESFTVRSQRLRLGLSQKQLGNRIGTSQSHIARIERGTEDIQLSTFRKLAEALDLNMNQMFEALENQRKAGQGEHRD